MSEPGHVGADAADGAPLQPGTIQVAIIIPAYNSAHFLRRCIDSVLAQTFPATEVVVVDDGSSDNTREVVAAYGAPVRYHWQPNGGLSAARNTGVRVTESPWVAFLDADDWWEPSKLALQAKALAANPDAILCYTAKVLAHENGERVIAPAIPPERLWPTLRYGNPITPSTVVLRRDAFESVGGFDQELNACEDWDLWFRLGPRRAMVAVFEPVTNYRVTAGSMSSNVDRMLSAVRLMLAKTLLNDLSGWRRWAWRRRAWSAELTRCAVTAWEAADRPRALALNLRSIATWPSPMFFPQRWRRLVVYSLRRPRNRR